jgi:primosomal protein N' (replication factor Y)
VVEVPIQKKNVKAIVVSSVPLESQKISLKKSGFQLKKLEKILIETPQVSSVQFQIAVWLAKNYYAPLGMSLNTVLPPFFNIRGYRTDLISQGINEEPPSELAIAPPLFLEARAHQTIPALEPFIKDTVRHGGQVLIISPDSTTAKQLYAQLKDYAPSCFVSSELSNVEYYAAWQSVAAGECKLIVGTRVGLFLPFRDLWMLAVEDPFHESYKSEMTPKYNTPDVALKVAALSGARAFFVAPIANMNIQHAIDQKTFEHERKRPPSSTICDVVDISYERKTDNFSLLSRELQHEIKKSLSTKERILLISPRRAHSGVYMCQNCGTMIQCSNCSIPMRVHRTSDTMLVCYHCSAYQDAPKNCANCHSTKLAPSGTAGSQKIEESMQRFLLEQQIAGVSTFIVDTDLTRDDAQEKELFDAIDAAEQSIVIATQMIFSHRYTRQFDLIGIINADALMSSADFRVQERFLYQFEKLLDFQPRKMIIQTYDPQSPVLAAAIREEHLSFYTQELPARKAFYYPPYSRLIKLTYTHASDAKASYESRVLNEKLRRALALDRLDSKIKILGPTPALIGRERNQYHYTIVLKVDPELPSLDAVLKYVPTYWQIDVDPKQIL